MRRPAACHLAACTVLALALAPTAVVAGAEEAETIHYRCGHLPVAYINTSAGESYAVLVQDAKLVTLKAGLSGSGVRYVSIDGSDLIWHVKADEGFLARDDARETMILANCKAR